MSEKEKETMQAIAEALPKMSEFKKGYLLGVAETMTEKGAVGEALKER